MKRDLTHIEFERRIANGFAEKEKRRHLNHMAEALCNVFAIPVGNGLVMLLTRFTDIRNNQEAVFKWVEEKMAELDLGFDNEAFPILVDLLEKKLRSITEGPSWR